MGTYSYCRLVLRDQVQSLRDLHDHRFHAVALADGIYHAACRHTNTIDEKVQRLLQQLRDDVVSRGDAIGGNGSGGSSSHSSSHSVAVHDSLSAEGAEAVDALRRLSLASAQRWHRALEVGSGGGSESLDQLGEMVDADAAAAGNNAMPSLRTTRLSRHRGDSHDAAAAAATSAVVAAAAVRSARTANESHSARSTLNRSVPSVQAMPRLSGGGTEESETASERRNRLAVLRLRRAAALPAPIMFESLTSSAALLKALERIFRTYVRGNALPGQLTGGNTVEFDGLNLPQRTFILQGPYLSFAGFVRFLLDFNVASAPPAGSALAQSFESKFGAAAAAAAAPAGARGGSAARSPRGSGGPDAGGADGLVPMVECALLFVEACRTTAPALTLKKFRKYYTDIAALSQRQTEEARQPAQADRQAGSWSHALHCLQNKLIERWDIRSGMNFAQFIDCLGVSSADHV